MVDDEGGERVAAGQDAVEGAHEQRVEREEGGPRLELEVGDVRGDRARVAAADDLQVPQAVPLREHAGDQPERAYPASGSPASSASTVTWLAAHAGPGEHAEAGHGEGADPDRQRLAPRALLAVRRRVATAGDGSGRRFRLDRRSAGVGAGHHHRYIGRMRRRGPKAGGRRPAMPISRTTRPRDAAERFEQFEHAGVVGPGLAGEVPRHHAGEVVVADDDGVVVAAHGSEHAGRRSTARRPARVPAWRPARRAADGPSPTAGRRGGRSRRAAWPAWPRSRADGTTTPAGRRAARDAVAGSRRTPGPAPARRARGTAATTGGPPRLT